MSIPTTSNRLDSALLALRLVFGAIFIAHGAQKLFVFGLAGVSGAFGQMGIPLAGFTGPFIAFLEFFGGIALVLGLLTRLASLGLAFNMIGAILLVHLSAGFFLPNGVEFALACLGASIALTLTGAGRFSADALIASRRSRAAGDVHSVVARRAA